MIRTEKQWLEVWCPFTRTIATGVVQVKGPGGMGGTVPIAATVNRTESTIQNKHGIPTQCMCIGAACGAWEETHAAKKPESEVLTPDPAGIGGTALGYCRLMEVMPPLFKYNSKTGESSPLAEQLGKAPLPEGNR